MERCEAVQEALSARADGEAADLDEQVCADHLSDCAECRRFAVALPVLLRTTRLAPAQEVPDLTSWIMAAAADEHVDPEVHRRRQVRAVLAVVGLAQVVVAILALLGENGHVGRELATWQLALGTSFGVAAWQPHRAAGLLPMVAVLGLAAVVSAVGDLLAGATTLAVESQHLVEVAGVALVASVARSSDPTRPRHLVVR